MYIIASNIKWDILFSLQLRCWINTTHVLFYSGISRLCVVLVSSIPQEASVFSRQQTGSIFKVSIQQTLSLVWNVCWPVEKVWLFSVVTFRLYIMHIDFCFFPVIYYLFFWVGVGGAPLTLTHASLVLSHNFLNVHTWINECRWG